MKRKKNALFVIIFLLIAVLMISCAEEKGPTGVCVDDSGKEYYAIRLSSKETPKDYFELNNLLGQTAVMATFGDTSVKTVSIYSVADGGKIAFLSDYSGKMFYFPKGFTYEEAEKLATRLTLMESNFMSISSAKHYIPSLSE